MGRKKRRKRADRERSTERDSAGDEERDAASALGTPLGMPDAPIPDSPMPDAPIPDAGVPDMGMPGASMADCNGATGDASLAQNQAGPDLRIQRTPRDTEPDGFEPSISDYQGQHVDIGDKVRRIAHEKDDWDHNQLGESVGDVRETLQKVITDPDEVYGGTRASDDATVRVYVSEVAGGDGPVVVFALVVDGRLITSFVPAGEAHPGAPYEDVYDRDKATTYIIREVLQKASGHSPMTKVDEFDQLITQIEEGESI
ncbi:hypothetical protein Halru_0903 [Halovivax ruber XH-70]|uniref:Uncharacterized protein n=1 Tax=Halovivax ruber (strain DSM 18193 / JCM 13892 / XH-70) TaxID=797302 RepID=L0I9X4_HALRX|nr:hypothetical protein [Halovivax ruber]AGB15524.1 hypothetical protein Halru_0903 [Halovivax ruber XH-70]